MYVDPSEHFFGGVASITLNLSLSNIVSSGIISLGITSGILFQLRANKMYDISRKMSPFLDESNKFREVIPHMYINASEIEWPGNGFRYDVACANPDKAFRLGITEGGINKTSINSSEWTNTSFVKLSPLQFLTWERENYEYKKNKKYHLIFSSCWTWSYQAWLSGVRIMLTVPSI